MAYVRGSQVQFILLPDMLAKAPYFNRIKLWRKFKGNAVFGGGAFINKAGMLIRPGTGAATRPSAAGGPPGGTPGGQFAPGVRDGPGPRGPPGIAGLTGPYGAPRGPVGMGGYGGPPNMNMGGYPPSQYGPPAGNYQQQQQQPQQYQPYR